MKYWAYVNNEILGPFEKEKLLELPSFSPSLLVCPQTPVGEKTEDWKEASTYPELSSLIGRGSLSHASAPETFAPPQALENPIPAAEPFSPPPAETPSINFKPLTASHSVEPVPPAEHGAGMMEIQVNRLGKAAPEPADAPQEQRASSFDPISLSHIERRSETISAQEAPAPANNGIALEPQTSFQQPAPKAEIPAFVPAAEPPAAAIIETFSRPAPAPAPAVADTAGLEALIQRLDALSKAAATRQDINSAVDPLKLKLDQMGEVISSIKNSQFQREVMDKLTYLENSVGELKDGLKKAQAAPAKIQKVEIEKNSDTVYGAQPVKKAEKARSEPAETAKPAEITDHGSQPSRIAGMLKKVFKFALTLVLLAAVLLGAVIGLKTFGVFDATKFLPFPLPFIGAQPELPAAEQTQPASQPELPGAQPAAQPETPKEQAAEKAMAPEIAPEIIYITRTYKLAPGGQSLEDKIFENAAKAGGDYNKTAWEVRPSSEGMFEIDALIPGKAGNLVYTFLVNREKKTVLPFNEEAKAPFEAMARDAAKKPAGRKGGRQAAAKAVTRQAPKAQPKKAAPKKVTAPEDEYEYEYVEDDGAQ